MSTPLDRAHRAAHRILPLKRQVRQTDGSFHTQIVDASVRTPSTKGRKNDKGRQDWR